MTTEHPSPAAAVMDGPLPRIPGTSLHRQLFMVLRDEILRGVYAQGLVPTEEALCERFGVSRITVRRALADLQAEGLVERRHGRGTFVRADRLPLMRAQPSLSLVESLRQTAEDTQVDVLGVTRAPPPPAVAALLAMAPGERGVHALRLRSIDGVPVMLTDAWVPESIGAKVTVASLRRKALYEILLAQGLKFGRAIQEITAEISDPERARLLQVGVGLPLLKIVRVIHDPRGRPLQHLVVTMTPERSRILMDIPGETVNTLSAGQFVHDAAKRRG